MFGGAHRLALAANHLKCERFGLENNGRVRETDTKKPAQGRLR
jgi:hypothetical protein